MNSKSIEDVLKYINKSVWKDDISDEVAFFAAQNFVNSLPKETTHEKTIHRIAGQSKQGKTKHVVLALSKAFENNNIKPCHIAVKTFASFHPKYEDLIKQHGKKHITEKTKGFALKCLTYALKLLMQGGFLIVLELTLLKKVFEKYIVGLIFENNYKAKFHILAVSSHANNAFILKTKHKFQSIDNLSITLKPHSNYFNKHFQDVLKFLTKQNNLKADAVIWNENNLLPCFNGKLKNSYKSFKSSRKLQKDFVFSKNELLKARQEFYKNAILK